MIWINLKRGVAKSYLEDFISTKYPRIHCTGVRWGGGDFTSTVVTIEDYDNEFGVKKSIDLMYQRKGDLQSKFEVSFPFSMKTIRPKLSITQEFLHLSPTWQRSCFIHCAPVMKKKRPLKDQGVLIISKRRGSKKLIWHYFERKMGCSMIRYEYHDWTLIC